MDICTTIIEICKDNSWDNPQVSVSAESYEQITWHDDNPNNITVDQIKAKQEELKTAYANAKYQRDRAEKGYASVADQLDMQYWDSVNGTTIWKDHVAKVKSDFPKPD
tara:strand:+ start:449 stop:772 length:324 start_codon:yes stop_codon:yes gene_type:complete